MRRLILFLFLVPFLSCRQGPGKQAAVPAGDSVLNTPLLLPLTDSIRQFPDNAALYYRRALLLFNTDPRLALADFEQAAKLDPAATDHWAGAGEAALLTEDYGKAAASFERALQTAPGNAYLRYRLAMAWVEGRHYHRADSMAGVLASAPDTYAQAYYLRARMAEDRKDTTLAIAHLKKAVDAAGAQNEYEAVMELADLLQARRSPDALPYYELAFQLDAGNADPLYAKAQLYEQLGNRQQATVTYKRCIVADPGYAAAYIALGKMSMEAKQWKAAMEQFNLAARARPAEAAAYYYRGLCQEQLGNKAAATDDYAKALSFRKAYPEAKAALARISGQ